MGRRTTFTEAEIKRALKAARESDPGSVVEMTRDGVMRILPPSIQNEARSEVDRWFEDDAR